MQREIKFRGKRVDNGEWIDGSLVIDKNGGCQIIDYADHVRDCYTWHEVLPESVGQYTGLKDRSGKEIYEGDIVQYSNSMENGKAIVKYQSCTFVFDWFEQNTSSPSIIAESMSYFQCSAELEIIGNTIDNPELIKP